MWLECQVDVKWERSAVPGEGFSSVTVGVGTIYDLCSEDVMHVGSNILEDRNMLAD